MSARLRRWKTDVEALWSAETLPVADAQALVTDIIRQGGPPEVVDAARQTLPSLKRAATKGADEFARALARRRFGLLRVELARPVQQPFGRRVGFPGRVAIPGEAPTGESAHRRLLGLAPTGTVSGAEIAAAFRRVAKAIHPDRGGNADAFSELIAARKALMGRG